MRKMWTKFFTTSALTFMLCMTGLVMSGTAFAQQCVDNGDGTVTDNGTGLMWQKATAGPMNWDAAMNYTSGLSLAGHSDWALADANTLVRLYSSACKSLLEGAADSLYWSYTSTGSEALTVTFNNSDTISVDKSIRHHVRAARQNNEGNTKARCRPWCVTN
jgi:hypothetical protein